MKCCMTEVMNSKGYEIALFKSSWLPGESEYGYMHTCFYPFFAYSDSRGRQELLKITYNDDCLPNRDKYYENPYHPLSES